MFKFVGKVTLLLVFCLTLAAIAAEKNFCGNLIVRDPGRGFNTVNSKIDMPYVQGGQWINIYLQAISRPDEVAFYTLDDTLISSITVGERQGGLIGNGCKAYEGEAVDRISKCYHGPIKWTFNDLNNITIEPIENYHPGYFGELTGEEFHAGLQSGVGALHAKFLVPDGVCGIRVKILSNERPKRTVWYAYAECPDCPEQLAIKREDKTCHKTQYSICQNPSTTQGQVSWFDSEGELIGHNNHITLNRDNDLEGQYSAEAFFVMNEEKDITCTVPGSVEHEFLDLEPNPFTLGEVFIPNAFSPNRDGINDLFTFYTDDDWNTDDDGAVESDDLQKLYIKSFVVANRWGETVWHMNNFWYDPKHPEEVAWDGIARGQKMNSGVFVYFLDVPAANQCQEDFFQKGGLHLMGSMDQ